MSNFGFERRQRLLKSSEFKNVFDNVEIKVSGPHFLFLVRQTDCAQPGRLGLVVGKKNIKTAVARNRFKRRVRETFRMSQNDLVGLDIIVMARRGAGELDPKNLAGMLEKSWLRVKTKHDAIRPK